MSLQYKDIVDLGISAYNIRYNLDVMDYLTIRHRDEVLQILNQVAEDVECIFNKISKYK